MHFWDFDLQVQFEGRVVRKYMYADSNTIQVKILPAMQDKSKWCVIFPYPLLPVEINSIIWLYAVLPRIEGLLE